VIDSDMYVFGLGSFVFLLAGVVVATSADSQAPEYVFKAPKIGFAAAVFALVPLCFMIGLAELNRAQARGALDARDGAAVIAHANSAMSLAFADGQAASIKALVTRTEEDLTTAAKFHPSPKAFRALADFYIAKPDVQAAFRALNRALERDPNNASALKKYYETASVAGNEDLAVEYAQKLIASEKTSYFTVRSQPEFVPLQTYQARLYLAELPRFKEQRTQLLTEAFKGFRDYREKTVPTVLRMSGGNRQVSISGEDHQSLTENMTVAKWILEELKKAKVSDSDIQFEAEFARFTEVFEALSK
ncbi:MAG TPA: hypothetical protein VK171_15445, partial [Fimbriimonas sp.]|nr:hypothetical protein [Fimbriimonas sp.]